MCGGIHRIFILIIVPSVDEHQYVDRQKIDYSINMMATVDSAGIFFASVIGGLEAPEYCAEVH